MSLFQPTLGPIGTVRVRLPHCVETGPGEPQSQSTLALRLLQALTIKAFCILSFVPRESESFSTWETNQGPQVANDKHGRTGLPQESRQVLPAMGVGVGAGQVRYAGHGT